MHTQVKCNNVSYFDFAQLLMYYLLDAWQTLDNVKPSLHHTCSRRDWCLSMSEICRPSSCTLAHIVMKWLSALDAVTSVKAY